ncbi:MAG: glycosyltransferase family 4 protein, partial [Clostridiaceae bacterium]|nr:glycosyltransferase family 4 protein [Clostridiaceae bacterium]
MSRKKVLYIGGFELPDKNAAAQRVIANAKILRDLGYDSIFIGVDKTRKEEGLSIKYNFEGFDYFQIKYPQSKPEWMKYLVSLKNILPFIINEGISHIIAYNYPSIALYRLRRFCNKNKLKLIGDCADWYEAKGGLIFKFIKNFDVYLRMKIVHPKLDGLIVISDYLYEYYKNRTNKLINLPPLVDLSMKKWELQRGEIKNKHISLIYAGWPFGVEKDRLDIIINILMQIKKEHQVNVLFSVL